ncbi:hypothetical protein N0V83_007201 [Neocucurbitaria cava]|uniref:Uncharacterized protein n=1 Tax=Neocucurbitaria cava TaxID=798079 RepID=A0A9W8Y526_9PLEO|nr:hypothetical protein N0V83_007201 [Neocucurbitaria cava]
MPQHSTPRTKSRTNNAVRKTRAPSSSPPPIADLEQPQVEPMHKGLSKFDLRDDEWMMVEDELLETAKSFTRHLHIAEYERLKEKIEEKKKEAEVARPVVANAKLSIEGAMKEKAKVQEKKQRKAIRDVFASQNDEDATDEPTSMRPPESKAVSSLATSHRPTSATSKWSSKAYPARDTDSNDLDAPQRPATTPDRTNHTTAPYKSASSSLSATNASPSFAKPAPLLQPPSKPRSRISRATPFDMLDDYTPRKNNHPATSPKPTLATDQRQPHAPASSSSLSLSDNRMRASSPLAKAPGASDSVKNSRAGRSVEALDEWGMARGQGSGSGSGKVSSESMERLAKRKAEREREEKDREQEKKRKAVKLDDIPTFLF